jgi:2-C-methyl-D-erythritol 4-phosphate cytidylyltransferase
MRARAFPGEARAGLLAAGDVAHATLQLLASDLTGQVVDVRRHDAVPLAAGSAGSRGGQPDGQE